jgi:signal transduction histidine kinase
MLRKHAPILAGFAVIGGLFVISHYNYLLFHSLAEIFSIIVACGIFIIAWNSRRNLDNNYLALLGIAYLIVGTLDLLHTLSYKGMGVFPTSDANLPTQLWIAARYVESISLIIAPLFLRRKINMQIVLIIYISVLCLLLLTIFYKPIFPDSFIEGTGLTPFKKISEIIISLIFVGAIIQLIRKRNAFDKTVLGLLIASIALSIGAEVSFIFYLDVYGISNLLGHLLKIISFYFIYRALIMTGLVRPFDLLYRNLKRSESSLRKKEKGLRELNATKDRFFSIIAHDLRSPISSITTIARYLRSDFASLSEEERRSLLYELDLTSQRTIDLLDNLLQWAKCQTGDIQFKPDTCNLHPLLVEAIVPLGGSARSKNISLEITDAENLRVFVDRNMITTVVRNLVSNAIKFSYPGSIVKIDAEKDGKLIKIRVRDRGLGIDSRDIPKLFRVDSKFTRLGTAREKGTGLGLVLSRDFIKMNGGTIHVVSAPKEGTSVTFTVPAAPN